MRGIKRDNHVELAKLNYIKLFVFILIIICISSFGIGRYPIAGGTLLKVLFSKFLNIPHDWPGEVETVIFKIRLPRIIGGLLVGGSLALSGAVYQGVFKNPLVSPDVLGVSSGAAFGASLGILFSWSRFGIQALSFAFGLVAVAMVYFIGSKIKENPLISLVITGILVGSIFSSLTSLIKYIADTNDKLPTITFWLMGSLADISLKEIKVIIIPIIMGVIPLYILRWRLNVLSLDEDEAKTLGLNTNKIRILVIISSTLLTASVVSISGIVGWIGLVIPHLCRLLIGPDYMTLVPLTILVGASYLLIVDNIARSISQVEIPLGILTSLVGAPFFIFLLINNRGVGD